MYDFYYENGYDNVKDTLYDRMGSGSALINFYKDGEFIITKGPNKIKDSIIDIISTPYGTRFFLPEYGCRISECLLEPNDFVARDLAEMYVRDSLERWEPRITVNSIEVESVDTNMIVEINYTINSLGITDSYVYTMEKKVPDMGGVVDV